MNQTAIINIKTLPSVKSKAMEIANDLGLNLSSIINAYLKQFIRTKTINFSLNEKPSAYLLDQIKESKKDIKLGKISSAFTNSKDAIKWLNSDK